MDSAVLVAVITTIGAVIVAAIHTSRRENRRDHAEVTDTLSVIRDDLRVVADDVRAVKADAQVVRGGLIRHLIWHNEGKRGGELGTRDNGGDYF